jgi:DNA-binding protein HU-beta
VNKAQLVEALAERLGGDKKTAAAAVESTVDIILRAVSKGEKVAVTGFGVFEKRERAARMARNPATGERVRVKKTSVPAFRPGQGFKDVVSGARKLPKVAAATATNAAKATAARTTARITAASGATKAAGTKATGTKVSKAAAEKAPAKSGPAPAKTGAAKSTAAKAAAKKAATKAPAAKKAPAVKKAEPAKKAPSRKAAAAKK